MFSQHFFFLKNNITYNQGQNWLDRLSLFSFIHPFHSTNIDFFADFQVESLPQFLYSNAIPPSHPRFNVGLNSGVCASTIQINIENGERGKSLVITPQWSNTFGPDCRGKLSQKLKNAINILVHPVVLELLIKTYKILF